MAEIFKNIQTNQTVYILDTKALQLREGTVKDNQPHIGSTYTMGMQAQMMRDVTIESEGKQLTYTIPEQLAVTYAADLVLSTDREGLSAEVERMKQAASSSWRTPSGTSGRWSEPRNCLQSLTHISGRGRRRSAGLSPSRATLAAFVA